MALIPLSQSIEWMGIRFGVPEDWQVVRHGLSPDVGSLTLVDRRRERLELSWTRCKNRPDLHRLIRDYRERVPPGRGSPKGSPEPFRERRYARGWRGFEQSTPTGETLCRTVLFHADTSRLLEATLSIRAGDAGDLVQRLLESIVVTSRGEESTRWCIFDIDVTTPPGLRLVRTQVKPADVALSFVAVDSQTGKPTRNQAILRRRGMAKAWHTGDLAALIRHGAEGARYTRWHELSHHGCSALLAEGTESGPRYKRLLGRLRARTVLAWCSPKENAVYELSTTSAPEAPLGPSDFTVRFREALQDPHRPETRASLTNERGSPTSSPLR